MTGTDITDYAITYLVEQGFTRETDTHLYGYARYVHPSGRARVEIVDALAASFAIQALSAGPAKLPLWNVQTYYAPHAVFTATVETAITEHVRD